MVTRLQFIRTGLALGGVPLAGCGASGSGGGYEATVKNIWQPTVPPIGGNLGVQRELVRLATLAPSGHNTQCWKFQIASNAITILPDLTRRTPVVDPDDHHLFVSLGCALENMAQASMAFGLKAQAQLNASTNAIHVSLDPTQAFASPLYQAINKRQCTRGLFDGQPLDTQELKALEVAGAGNGVRVMLLTAKPDMEKILEFVMQGNTTQLSDAAFVKELKQWIRFGAGEAVKTGDGLYSITSGNLSGPRWLGSPLFDLMISDKSENEKCARQIRSSAGIAVFISSVNDKTHWIEAGRCYERFALQATSMGIRNAMLNQPVEVPAMRQQLAGFLGTGGGRPDLVLRFGRGPLMPQSLRRAVAEVLM